MECRKWEETGLLYVNGELSENENAEFSNHLSECEYCRKETDIYNDMKKNLFTDNNLLDSPSSLTDEKIFKACMKIPRPASTGIGLFTGNFKKVFYSMIFLIVGFSAGLYVTYNLNYSESTLQVKSVETNDVREVASSDSIAYMGKDSTVQDTDKAYVPSPRGDLSADGAISVGVSEQK